MKKISIPVKREYLNKENCRREAERIIREKLIDGMSVKQLAHEIYFHALVYYWCERTGLLGKMKAHAQPIDIADGGDTRLRRIAYDASWLITRGKKHSKKKKRKKRQEKRR